MFYFPVFSQKSSKYNMNIEIIENKCHVQNEICSVDKIVILQLQQLQTNTERGKLLHLQNIICG